MQTPASAQARAACSGPTRPLRATGKARQNASLLRYQNTDPGSDKDRKGPDSGEESRLSTAAGSLGTGGYGHGQEAELVVASRS